MSISSVKRLDFLRYARIPPSIRSLILNSLSIGIVVVLLLILFLTLWRVYFNAPPISITSLDAKHLGSLCPGQRIEINNQVSVNDDVIVFYYTTTMDSRADYNYIGTQRAYTDLLHPHPSKFRQRFDWTVPDLEPGQYTRVFGARNVGSIQDVIFVITRFDVGPDCPNDP